MARATGSVSSSSGSTSTPEAALVDSGSKGGRLLPRGFDSDLAPADDAVDAALVPEVREIRPEGSEPFSRELEVVRIRQREKSQARERATSCRSPNGS